MGSVPYFQAAAETGSVPISLPDMKMGSVPYFQAAAKMGSVPYFFPDKRCAWLVE